MICHYSTTMTGKKPSGKRWDCNRIATTSIPCLSTWEPIPLCRQHCNMVQRYRQSKGVKTDE